jgi:hypothetical protein
LPQQFSPENRASCFVFFGFGDDPGSIDEEQQFFFPSFFLIYFSLYIYFSFSLFLIHLSISISLYISHKQMPATPEPTPMIVGTT